MVLFGRKVPIIFSLAIWFIVWELIGQAKLSIATKFVMRSGL